MAASAGCTGSSGLTDWSGILEARPESENGGSATDTSKKPDTATTPSMG